MALEKLCEENVEDPTLTRIFGTSSVFRGLDQPKVSVKGLLLPNKIKEHFQHGQDAIAKGEWEKAVISFSKSINLNPHMVESYVFRAEAFLQLCDFASAAQNLRKATLLAPHQQEFMERLCFVLYLQPNQCYQDLHRALSIQPEHPEANTLLEKLLVQAKKVQEEAMIAALKGNLEDSLIRINCAIENNPMDPGYYLFRGTLFRRLKDFDAAIEDFVKALELSPESEDNEVARQAQRQLLLTYNDFAVFCYTKCAYEEGVLLLNKALRGEKKEKGIYINRGDCFFKLGELTFAEADYLEALTLCPGDQGARYRMGMVQEKLGLRKLQLRQYHKAEKHFTSAIEYNPERANLYLLRARSRLVLQDIFGARQDVVTMLLLNPKHPQLVPMMANLFPGQSTESVLNSKTMVMAKTVLERAMQNQLQNVQDVLGLLNKSPSREEVTGPCPNTEEAELQEDVSRISIVETQDENLTEGSLKQAVSQEVNQEVSQEVSQEEEARSSPRDQTSLGQTSSLETKIADSDQSESKTTVVFS
ncbi:tetratricopeptide repeat protein 16 isoform X5 [Sminthopsis crassicaudata]|uniref:tetratricopeptide repeat protein 16 isoform X5 n=1 Tax=Sminthopsis crassicaudata TaxID=9301 RepID=UPI003D69FC9D